MTLPPGLQVELTGETDTNRDGSQGAGGWGEPDPVWSQVWSGVAVIADTSHAEDPSNRSQFVDAIALVTDPEVPLSGLDRLVASDGRVWSIEGKPYRVRDGVGPHHTVFELREANTDPAGGT